jgi:hypothetical protein
MRHWFYPIGLDFSFQKTPIITNTKKKELFSQEMLLKISLLKPTPENARKSKKPLCIVSRLHFFVK